MLKNNLIINKVFPNKNHLILFCILVIGTILRLYNLPNLPFSHDEISALLRTEFYSLHEVIEGVKFDYHPAGVQVFLYYWVNIFGKSEWVVKLPFIITSISSIYLMFQVGKKWKNETVGLLCASFIATTQYSVMYGTTARPYSFGLFFILLLVNSFLSIRIQEKGTYNLKYWVLFIFAGTCAAYNHHYSLFIAGLLGLTGLFFIPRTQILKYLLCGIIILILYIPHIPILIYQLGKGGVGGEDGWLAAPTPIFPINYLQYLFHFSIWPILVTFGIIVFGFFQARLDRKSMTSIILALLLFAIPIVFGYCYSIWGNPILQFSILIFSHFFLYLFLFGHFKELSIFKNSVLVISILTVNTITLIVNRQHFSINYNSIYEHVLTDLNDARKTNPKIPGLIECQPAIISFYEKQKYGAIEHTQYRNFQSQEERLNYLDSIGRSTDYFYFGETSFSDPNFVAIILTKFPNIVWQKNYFTGSTYLFSKKGKSPYQLITKYSEGKWSDATKKELILKDGYYFMDSTIEYSPVFQVKTTDILSQPSNKIDILADFGKLPPNSDIKIVVQLETIDSLIQWEATSMNQQYVNKKSNQLVHSFKLFDHRNYKKSTIKIFLWNSSMLNIQIKDLLIRERAGNPIIFSLFEPIK